MPDAPEMTRSLLYYGGMVVVVAVGLKLLVPVLEPRLAFFPMRGEQATPADFQIDFETLSLRTSDGETIHGWLLDHAEPRATVVFWHGNGGNLSLWLDQLVAIQRHRMRVVAIDYRGYGLSTGSPSERGVYRDTDALLAFIGERRDRWGPALVYWGRSLGGPIAAYAATRLPPDGLVLESTFADVAAVLRGNPVMRVLGLFGTYRFPTLELARAYDGPVLVIHGDEDEIVPYRRGVELHAGLGERARMATIEGGTHNDLHAATDERYWAPVDAFVDAVGS